MPAFIHAKKRSERPHARRAAPLSKSARVADILNELAPPAPPCFLTRRAWVLRLLEVQVDARCPSHAKPLAGQGGGFNADAAFCRGCTPERRKSLEAGACQPDWCKRSLTE